MKLPAPRSLSGPRAVVAAGTAGLLVVGAVGVVLVRGTGGPDDDAKVAEASRVLQSVSATVGSDGTITALDGTVVAVDADGASSTTTTEYSPEEMADELPVRVRTSYRTDEGSGTDLDDLDGYDGRVEIALTVENLTVEPERLTYDVNGNQRTRTALVGVPLSVVASADLGDVDPASIVTDGTSGDATNGVLSRSEDDRTQVQWATIIAPPQLGTTATLRLVLDAEDFSAPDVDLSVQQGLVTDPSLGALVDAAFNPASSEELALQQRTIALIGEVNTVIARAGESIGDVRSTLRRSAETIGEKTVSDLQSSTRSIASSMEALGQSVDSLGNDLAGALESTGSTAVSQLQSSVASIDALLGSTDQALPTAQVTGAGCETTVALPGRDATLYGSLLSVSSQLDAYARATQACKGFVQQRLISTIGTDVEADACLDPSRQQEVPEDQRSVTCVLFKVAQQFDDIGRDLETERARAVSAITDLPYEDLVRSIRGVPAQTDPATPAVPGLVDHVSEIEAAIADVDGEDSLAGALARLALVEDDLDLKPDGSPEDAGTDGDGLVDEIFLLHSRAEDERDAIGTPDEGGSIAADLLDVRNALCTSNSLDSAINQASLRMVGSTCNVPPILGGSLLDRLADQREAWQDVADQTDLDNSSSALGARVAAVRSATVALRQRLDQGVPSSDGSGRLGGVNRLVGNLAVAAQGLDELAADVLSDVDEIQDGVGTQAVPGTAITTINDAFANAQDGVNGAVRREVQQTSTDLVRQVAQDATDIGAAFERSASGLNAAGNKVRADGKATIDEQKGKLGGSTAKSVQALTASVKGGLGQIQKSVTGSTRDTEAASRILQADLQNVLLDLGTRDVDGSGLLGSMAASAATAGTANVTLAEATDTTTSFAGVRDSSIAGLYLRQAQADASFARQADQPAFGLDLPASAQHRTVYTFHVRTGK